MCGKNVGIRNYIPIHIEKVDGLLFINFPSGTEDYLEQIRSYKFVSWATLTPSGIQVRCNPCWDIQEIKDFLVDKFSGEKV